MCRQRGRARAQQVLVWEANKFVNGLLKRDQRKGSFIFHTATASLWGREGSVAGVPLFLQWSRRCLIFHKKEGLNVSEAGFLEIGQWLPTFLPILIGQLEILAPGAAQALASP